MKVLTYSQIKTAEETAVNNGLFSYVEMMQNAGDAAFEVINQRYLVTGKRFLIIAGCGNNGGDGIVLANKLKNIGALVSIFYPLGIPATDTASGFIADAGDIPVINRIDGEFDYYVDALFGIGFNRMLSPEIKEVIDTVNSRSGVKIAVDLPSGVFCDGGMAQTAFRADLTVTFIAYKLCLLLPPTSSFCGEIILEDIGVDVGNNYSYGIIEKEKAPVFDKNSHKGIFGTALLVCGSYGMCGAQILSAKAAAVSGAGIVKSIVCDKNYTAFTQSVPEAVTIPVETSDGGAPVVYERTLLSAVNGADALLIGCGLGNTDEAKSLVKKVLTLSNIPTVLDADGINAIAGNISIISNANYPLILTPHPGEMARLLNTTVEDVQNNRVVYAKRFACENRCVLVLKGANTVVAAPNGEVFFNVTGNYGMAKGGSGDVLSGIIVALLANGCDPLTAAKTAVYVHGKAGDAAARRYTKRTMLPSDLLKEIKRISF